MLQTGKKILANSSDSFTNSVTTNLLIFSSKLNVVIYINRGKVVLVLTQPCADPCVVIVITQGSADIRINKHTHHSVSCKRFGFIVIENS